LRGVIQDGGEAGAVGWVVGVLEAALLVDTEGEGASLWTEEDAGALSSPLEAEGEMGEQVVGF